MKAIRSASFLAAVALFSVGLCSCGVINPYELPSIEGMKLADAQALVGENIGFSIEYVKTNQSIEGRVLSYKDHVAGDIVRMNSTVTIEVAERVEDAASPLDDNPYIDYVSWMSKVTGPESVNEEMCLNAGVSGTDLGIPFTLPDGRIMHLYGDTFSAPNKIGMWNSNFMAISSDTNFLDGYQFDELVTRPNGAIKPFAQGLHTSNDQFNKLSEVTKIPTGAISVGEYVYIYYMSVRYWGGPTGWLVTYNQCVKARADDYLNFEEVEGLRWNDEDAYFAGQITPIEDPKQNEYIYFVSIPGGRTVAPVLFRVRKENIEVKDEYEYLTSADTWTKGPTGEAMLNENPYHIYPEASGEPCIVYSDYLGKYIYITARGNVHMHLADSLEGPWTGPYDVYTRRANDTYPVYGPYLHSTHVDFDGQRMFMQVTKGDPIYDTYICEVVFKEKYI